MRSEVQFILGLEKTTVEGLDRIVPRDNYPRIFKGTYTIKKAY